MKQSVYLETSIISYLASRPSRDLIVAANQQLTLEWWEIMIHGLDFLLTWNCRHISNAVVKNKLIEFGYNKGYKQPYICTPLELMAGT